MAPRMMRKRASETMRIRRTRRNSCSIRGAVCFFLLSCFVPIVTSSHVDAFVYGESKRQSLPRVRGLSSHSRRRAQNDKNIDKNATVAPSAMPSIITPAPSPAPSPAPTMKETLTAYPTVTLYPTLSPAPTSSPWPTITAYPTTLPTFSLVENSVGNLVMEMIVSDPTASAEDVDEGRASTLLDGVLGGMLEILCRIHYIMVEDDTANTFACPSDSSRRVLKDREDFPVVWTMSRVNVEDYEDENGNALMYWTVVFPVLEIGEAYSSWAVAKSVTMDEVNATALNGMYEDAYYATQKYIQRGYMDARLPDSATAIADPEEVAPVPAPGSYPSEQLDPHALHPMRIAGLILLVVTLVSWILLVKLAARRKKERDLDTAFAEINKGGLVTEAGLDLMLDVGRRESERAGIMSTGIEVVPRSPGGHQSQGKSDRSTKENYSDSEDQNRMLPLPGYLSNPSTYSAVIDGKTDISKEHAVVQAAKESTGSDANSLEDVNKTYSFLSIFGSSEEADSESDDVVLSPHGLSDDEDDAVQHPDGEVISNFMTMASKSSDSHESNAAGSQAGQSRPSSPDRRSTACSEANTPSSPESIPSGRKSAKVSASSPTRDSATSSTESTSGGKSATGSTRNSATSLTASLWL